MTTVLTGVFFFVLGRFRLGGLVRYLPYPVIGGFLAGTGWLLVRGSVGVMADVPLGFAMLGALASPEVAVRWLADTAERLGVALPGRGCGPEDPR